RLVKRFEVRHQPRLPYLEFQGKDGAVLATVNGNTRDVRHERLPPGRARLGHRPKRVYNFFGNDGVDHVVEPRPGGVTALTGPRFFYSTGCKIGSKLLPATRVAGRPALLSN